MQTDPVSNVYTVFSLTHHCTTEWENQSECKAKINQRCTVNMLLNWMIRFHFISKGNKTWYHLLSQTEEGLLHFDPLQSAGNFAVRLKLSQNFDSGKWIRV
ncbi:hypothetical protein CHARACLAT_001678 [Characodon lateralis]|uniref:Leptin receptor n=1 Tax=Characodon lateralis TaxID=208331 RepID=A0ABU7EFK4_9TELE|nr:hypothetical protein [Characodon lateralis]